MEGFSKGAASREQGAKESEMYYEIDKSENKIDIVFLNVTEGNKYK